MDMYDISVKDMAGKEISLGAFRGKVLLIVNTATNCGFTPQYAGLQKLYDDHRDKNFEVLDFPCNQFMNQAPGTDAEINEFCTTKFRTTFPRFAKTDVNGPDENPLYAFLKSRRKNASGAENIEWNFTKFLIDRAGNVVNRYGPDKTPETIAPDIEKLLG